jgi:hypothetical protein
VRGDHYYLYVGDVNNSQAGLSIDKCLIDYDISKNAFSWRSLQEAPTVFMDYRDDRTTETYNSATVTYNSAEVTYNATITSEERIFFGAEDGAVYQFDVGNTDDGNDIAFSMVTREFPLGNPSVYKLLQKLVIYADGGRGVQIQFQLDDGKWKTLGRIKGEVTELIFPRASKCRQVRFRVLESSSADSFDFEAIDIYFTYETLIK